MAGQPSCPSGGCCQAIESSSSESGGANAGELGRIVNSSGLSTIAADLSAEVGPGSVAVDTASGAERSFEAETNCSIGGVCEFAVSIGLAAPDDTTVNLSRRERWLFLGGSADSKASIAPRITIGFAAGADSDLLSATYGFGPGR